MKKRTSHSLINIGSGYEKSIKSFILETAKKIGVNSKIKFDNRKKFDGTPRKIVDVKVAKSYGWKPRYKFEKCFDLTYKNYLKLMKKNEQ